MTLFNTTMDRNNIIGFALIFVVLMIWSFFNSRQQQAQLIQQRTQDSITLAQVREDSLRKLISTGRLDTQQLYPMSMKTNAASSPLIAADSLATAQEYTLENEVLKVTLNSYGGRITNVELKDFSKMIEMRKGPDQKVPLYLLHHPSNRWNLALDIKNNKINTQDIIFRATISDRSKITFQTATKDGKQIVQSYTLSSNSYTIAYGLELMGMNNDLKNNTATFEWQNYIEAQEKVEAFEKTYTTILYKPVDDDEVEHIKFGSNDQETISTGVKWVSHAQQFFNTTLLADQSFKNISLESIPGEEGANYLNQLKTSVDIPFDQTMKQKLKIYIGPNEYSQLKASGDKMEYIISFGASILGTVNRWIIRPVFNFLSNFFSNKGIVILLLTLIVKMILFPLSYKMLHSQSKMAALKPEMAHLKEKYKDDPQQIQMESMKIYREFGVNPLGGCMPMLLQMPIWLALYQFFPASIEFRQASFLWANDLSSYDVFAKLPVVLPFYGGHVSLFTLIWVVSTLVFTYYSTKDQDFSMNPAMKYMQYIMPVFFLFFFNNSAAGLTAYMAFSNVLNIAQTLGGKALIFPESKMKLELQAARNKPKKKGGFQDKLETMMKEQKSKLEQKQKPTKR